MHLRVEMLTWSRPKTTIGSFLIFWRSMITSWMSSKRTTSWKIWRYSSTSASISETSQKSELSPSRTKSSFWYKSWRGSERCTCRTQMREWITQRVLVRPAQSKNTLRSSIQRSLQTKPSRKYAMKKVPIRISPLRSRSRNRWRIYLSSRKTDKRGKVSAAPTSRSIYPMKNHTKSPSHQDHRIAFHQTLLNPKLNLPILSYGPKEVSKKMTCSTNWKRS